MAKKLLAMVLGLTMMIGVAGCSAVDTGSGSNDKNADTQVSVSAELLDAAKYKSDKEPADWTIAVVVKDGTSDWFKRMQVGVDEFGKEKTVDVIQKGPANADAASQVQLVEDMINQGVDALCIVPIDPGALESVLKKAMEKGIVVISHEASDLKSTLYDVEAFTAEDFGNTMMQELAKAIKQSRIFHFGTLSMTDDNVKEATKRAIETAKNNGLIISFDPNLRPPLWKSLDDARNQIAYGLSQCDVLKISDNEIEFMTGTSDFDKGANILMERYPNIKLLNITAGADGSYSYYREIRAYVPSYLLGGTIDTTGAGDTFCGSVLNYLLDHDLENLSKENLIEMLQIANAAAYLVTTKKGAIRSMPDPKDVQKVVNNNYIRED